MQYKNIFFKRTFVNFFSHSCTNKRNKSTYLIIFLLSLILYLVYFFNVFEYARTIPFSSFKYPLDIDLKKVVENVLKNKPTGYEPLNNQFSYPFVINSDTKCRDEEGNAENVFLLVLIKSQIDHFEARHVIRKTWGREFGVPSVTIKRLFLLGVHPYNKEMQHKVGIEQQEYGDIIQQYFHDVYFNNTLKMMMGFQWALQYCNSAKFVAFFDDDYFVNMNNAVNMLQTTIRPTDEDDIIVGYVWHNTMPLRLPFSKWYISLDEYPYRFWPDYVTAGSLFLPMRTAERLYAGMQFTKILRFDDVFLGIVAYKLGVRLKHDNLLHFHEESYDRDKYRHVTAAHGFKNPEYLLKVWREQHELDKLE